MAIGQRRNGCGGARKRRRSNKPAKQAAARLAEEPTWLITLAMEVPRVRDFCKDNLMAAGFKFGARIINYLGGKPGDVGLFFSWPKSAPDEA